MFYKVIRFRNIWNYEKGYPHHLEETYFQGSPTKGGQRVWSVTLTEELGDKRSKRQKGEGGGRPRGERGSGDRDGKARREGTGRNWRRRMKLGQDEEEKEVKEEEKEEGHRRRAKRASLRVTRWSEKTMKAEAARSDGTR